jgi:hypothetical protein
MDTTTPEQRLDPRRREARPERLTIGGETLERNDIYAKRHGISEGTLNKGDRDGAPYVMIGMVKYRPVERMDAHILSRIQTHKPQPPKRRRRTGG